MRRKKTILLNVLPMVLFLSASSQTSHSHVAVHGKDSPATHNMLVVGQKTVFLSHLPMFQEKGRPPMPHRYQAILEVSFEQQGSRPQDNYFKDRQDHPAAKIYTINPERFELPTLVSSVSQKEPLRKFRGTVFRGHLEKLQGGEDSILSNVAVTVKRVVHFREFDPRMKTPAQLEYILFGKGEELFLAHFITTAPDFDQVVAVTVTGHPFSDEELAKGLKIVFPGTVNTSSKRLKEKQQINGEIKPDNTSATKKIQVKVNRELYFEEGELRVPPVFDTTAEEKKSGFF